MQLIDENQYFVESKKVIQLVLDTERNLEKQLKLADKLQLVKQQKSETRSPAEYEELEKLEKELERKIRFDQFNAPAVPKEHKEKVKKNVVVEQLEVDEKLNELKAELKGRIEVLEQELLPLIEGIEKLEDLKRIPNRIDLLLVSEIGERVAIPCSYAMNLVAPSNNQSQSSVAAKDLKKVIQALKKIEVPVETKGLLDFLKRGKK
ncbi:hypothetical protein [Cytobacillus luteolus]|uniref:hypothetical protein n=1 Tax=Litchfieldia luteola TaxID=682179 RepID=UPI001AE770C7|nr:hypothetical protein [Cytobacillus luteolus]MBP1944634.1 hypothetical protein [Cytobacillus luteolus]